MIFMEIQPDFHTTGSKLKKIIFMRKMAEKVPTSKFGMERSKTLISWISDNL